MYDVIGDIHGQADKLQALLAALGYTPQGGVWVPPAGRQAIFVGDLIDRGPGQLKVLGIVRSMVEAGHAQAVMGNHEFNAIGYVTRPAPDRDFLRPRTKKNRDQHAAFIDEVGLESSEHLAWVDWFKTLPLALDLGGIRVVHAWWDDEAVSMVRAAQERDSSGRMSDDFLLACYDKGSALYKARKLLTCGVEWDLPPEHFITDKEGQRHGEARLAVWRHGASRLRDIALVPGGNEHRVPDIEIPDEHRLGPVTGAPILFGHHWFSGTPRLESPKVACLDWSAAKDGPLVAYRWDGESELSDDKFVAVGGRP